MTGFDDRDAKSSTDINLDRPRRVGFCNPPADHQFKSGHSGNPRGRRKLVGDITLSLRAGLKEKIRITKGTVQKNVSKEDADQQGVERRLESVLGPYEKGRKARGPQADRIAQLQRRDRKIAG
jgi:hypothetical protein